MKIYKVELCTGERLADFLNEGSGNNLELVSIFPVTSSNAQEIIDLVYDKKEKLDNVIMDVYRIVWAYSVAL